MKKIFMSLVFGLVILSNIALADGEDDKPNWKDLMLEKLDVIIEKLQLLVDKDWSTDVTVEPNITISLDEPIDVNVLSEPEKECTFEKLNHKFIFSSPTDKQVLVLPKDIEYSEMNVLDVKGLIRCLNSNQCDILVNGNVCFTTRSTQNAIRLEDFCTGSFVEGINVIEITTSQTELFELFLEMETKSANC